MNPKSVTEVNSSGHCLEGGAKLTSETLAFCEEGEEKLNNTDEHRIQIKSGSLHHNPFHSTHFSNGHKVENNSKNRYVSSTDLARSLIKHNSFSASIGAADDIQVKRESVCEYRRHTRRNNSGKGKCVGDNNFHQAGTSFICKTELNNTSHGVQSFHSKMSGTACSVSDKCSKRVLSLHNTKGRSDNCRNISSGSRRRGSIHSHNSVNSQKSETQNSDSNGNVFDCRSTNNDGSPEIDYVIDCVTNPPVSTQSGSVGKNFPIICAQNSKSINPAKSERTQSENDRNKFVIKYSSNYHNTMNDLRDTYSHVEVDVKGSGNKSGIDLGGCNIISEDRYGHSESGGKNILVDNIKKEINGGRYDTDDCGILALEMGKSRERRNGKGVTEDEEEREGKDVTEDEEEREGKDVTEDEEEREGKDLTEDEEEREGKDITESEEDEERRGKDVAEDEQKENVNVTGDEEENVKITVMEEEDNENEISDTENNKDEEKDNHCDGIKDVDQADTNSISDNDMSTKCACQHCNNNGMHLLEFKRHMTRHDKKFVCEVCGDAFKSVAHLTAHISLHYGDKPFECLVCRSAFRQVGALHKHMQTHTNVKPMTWSLCDFVCKTQKQPDCQTALNNNNENVLKCRVCNFMCGADAKLQQHAQEHTRGQPFHCTKCSIKCWSKYELKRHLLTHTNVIMLTCQHCDFKCLRKHELNRHRLTHKELGPFTCSLCEFICSSKSLLIKHTVSHINDGDEDFGEISEMMTTDEATKTNQVEENQESKEQSVKQPSVTACTNTAIKPFDRAMSEPEKVVSNKMEDMLFKVKEKTTLKVTHVNCLHNSLSSEQSQLQGGKLSNLRNVSDGERKVGLRRSTRSRRKTSKTDDCETDSVSFVNDEEWGLTNGDTNIINENGNIESGKDDCHNEKDVLEKSLSIEKKMAPTSSGFDPIEEALLDGRIPNANVKRESTTENDLVLQDIESFTDSYFFQPENNLYYCKHCQYSCETVAYLKRHMKTHTDLEFQSCPHCEYFCKTDDQLKEHMVKHSNEGADDRPFPCGQCDYRSRTQGDLKRHLLTHLKVKPFACTMCSYSCARKSRLEEHWRIHTNMKPFTCTVCMYQCRSKQNLKSHLKRHSSKRQQSCPYCEFKSLTKPFLKRHLLQEHADKKSYACELCSFTSWLKTDLKKHEWVHSSITPFECEECGYKCRRISRLNEHMMLHKNIKPFKCKKCSYATRTRYHFKRHIEGHQRRDQEVTSVRKSMSDRTRPKLTLSIARCRSLRKMAKLSETPVEKPLLSENSRTQVVARREETANNLPSLSENEVVSISAPSSSHDCSYRVGTPATLTTRRKYVRGPKIFTCALCTYVCKKFSHLRRHMLCHSTERPYKCDKCEYTSKTEDNMRRHVKRHSGIKPYSCKLCEYRCYEIGDLNQHLLTHTDFKAYKCTLCDYAARKKYHLNEHMMIHSNTRPFLCSECGDSFRTNSKLREHTLKHTREKGVHCTLCKFKFRRQSDLNKHMKRHAEPKPEKEPKSPSQKEPKQFLCPECGLSFKYNSALKQHMITHTDEKPFPCPHCPYHCRTKAQLRSHVTKHSDSKPLACEYCPFTCKHDSSLRRHRLIHTCKEPMRCQFCKFTCIRSYDIKRHIQRKHNMETSYVHSGYSFKQVDHADVSVDNDEQKSTDDSANLLNYSDKQMDFAPHKSLDYSNKMVEFSAEKSVYTVTKNVDYCAENLLVYLPGKSVDFSENKSMDDSANKSVDNMGKSLDCASTKLMDYTADQSVEYPAGKMMDYSLKQIDYHYVNRQLNYPGGLMNYSSRPMEFMDKPGNFVSKPADYNGQHMNYAVKHI